MIFKIFFEYEIEDQKGDITNRHQSELLGLIYETLRFYNFDRLGRLKMRFGWTWLDTIGIAQITF